MAAPAKPSVTSAPVGKPAGKPVFTKPSAPAPVQHGKDYSGIVRILGKDLSGDTPLARGLTRIKGIGENLAVIYARAIEKKLGISRKKIVGDLNEGEIAKIEEVLKNPAAAGIATFQLNRQKDRDTGTNKHLLQADLSFAQRQDIQFEKETQTYRGWRHAINQRVRGQHSRTTGRIGMSVGVLKKAVKQAKAGAAPAKEEKK